MADEDIPSYWLILPPCEEPDHSQMVRSQANMQSIPACFNPDLHGDRLIEQKLLLRPFKKYEGLLYICIHNPQFLA